MLNAVKILNDVFGYNSFRTLQADIIKNVLDKQDTLVIMPTGGGKSICYQVPALIFKGLTIVISPLISLMKDQVSQLSLLGIDAALLNSSLSRQEYEVNYQKVYQGKAKLLYLAPESLGKQDLAVLFKKNEVDCLAVDEAHCISQWGHDFRKDYRLLGKFRKNLPSAVCIGLTATATPRVQDDIITNLNLKNCKKFVASFNRENLYLEVLPKRDAYQQTLDFLEQHKKQPGIIYCFSKKQVDELSEDLTLAGYSNKPYHAGLSDEERNKNQELFTKDEIDIIVATIAFGMGINKSNVRFVIHYDLPKNLESYYQEIGRSGRDGLRADCLLLFSYADKSKINYFINQKEDEKEKLAARQHLDAMVRYAESEECRRINLINYFGEKYSIYDCTMCDNCTGHAADKSDITIAAQKFLSAVKRTGEIFGMIYIADVLTGADSDKIIRNRHHELSVFGVGQEYNKKQWQLIGRQLIAQGLLLQDPEFGSLKVTVKALPVLKNESKVYGHIKEPEKAKRSVILEYDAELFDLLKKKRKAIADARNVAAFMVLTDKTLADIAIFYPLDYLELSRINGFGPVKLKQYGVQFLELILHYCKVKGINRKSRSKMFKSVKDNEGRRFNQVSESFNSGESLESICHRYNIKPDRVAVHFNKYVEEGGTLNNERLKQLVTLPQEKWEQVFNEIRNAESGALRPLFDKFNGEISYFDLKLLRIIFLNSTKESA